MSCEICGRSSCSRAFHSREAVSAFDDVADGVKDRKRHSLLYSINRIKDVKYVDDKDYVNLDDVINIIESY